MSLQGNLHIFEGADGCGKTTIAELLSQQLHVQYYAFPGREPGTLGEHIYKLHHSDVPMCAESLQLLHICAHIDALKNRIIPWLREGKTVVMDRFYWSTYVYGLVYGVPHAFLEQIINLERQFWCDWLTINSKLFVMTAAKPFNKDDDAKSKSNWDVINATYLDCFERYDSNIINRHLIVNDGTIEDALQQVRRFW